MFQCWSSFLSFREKKRHEERYFHSEEVQEFLNGALATARERFELIPERQPAHARRPPTALPSCGPRLPGGTLSGGTQ